MCDSGLMPDGYAGLDPIKSANAKRYKYEQVFFITYLFSQWIPYSSFMTNFANAVCYVR